MSLLQKIENKRARKLKEERNKKVAIATAGVATGAIVGTISGILIAPKSGKETIQDVKEKTNENINKTKLKVEDSKAKIKEYLDKRKNNSVESEENTIEEIEVLDEVEVKDEIEA